MSAYIDLDALVQVLLVSLAGGVGLVALYAFGIRLLGVGEDERRPSLTLAAACCFGLVVAGVALGLYAMLSA